MRDRNQRTQIANTLRTVAGEDAFLEADFIQEYLESHPDQDLDAILERRMKQEPLQYIFGEWEFWGLLFKTDARALIPRPDTELLTETALEFLHGEERVLDLCCGSGCIGISIAHSIPVELVSADISPDALCLTRENAEKNRVSLTAVESDLFDNISGCFDMIVCNPPYLNEKEMQERDASVRFEPVLALDGGQDGLLFYRRIHDCYKPFLRKGGVLILEIGYLQEKAVRELFPDAVIRYDYGNRPRCVVVRKND